MVDEHAECRAFVGLGGNLGDRLATLRSATRALAHDLPRTRLHAVSPVYETRPIGPSREPFLNAVAELRTTLPPRDLLERLLAIEARHGRTRQRRWDARTLDLDLLLVWRPTGTGWVTVEVDEEGLRLPHPRMTARDFVLVPLGDLVGLDAVVQGRPVRAWLRELGEEERTVLRRVEDEGLG